MTLVWLLIGLVLSGQTAARNAEQTGHVVDASGTRLAGVRVQSLGDKDQRTDASGSFRLTSPKGVVGFSQPDSLVRFSKPGFSPRTLPRAAVVGEIVLSPARQPSWTPPTCSGPAANRFGELMQFTAPTGVQLRRGADIDYRTVSVRRGRSWLTFGTGQFWTMGLPITGRLSEMLQVAERDVILSSEFEGAEYRGTLRNGNKWRTITKFFESIEYYNATAADAAYFDRIIDTLCFEPPAGATQSSRLPGEN